MKLLNYLLLLTAVADTADGSAIRTESAEVTTNDGRVRGRRFLSDAIADDEARRGDDDDDDDDDSVSKPRGFLDVNAKSEGYFY